VTDRRVVASGSLDMNLTNVNWDLHAPTREVLHIVDSDVSGPPRFVWIRNWKQLIAARR
jgi:hypothetical protein